MKAMNHVTVDLGLNETECYLICDECMNHILPDRLDEAQTITCEDDMLCDICDTTDGFWDVQEADISGYIGEVL